MTRPRLLYLAMYDPSGQDSAPKVRIRLLAEALERRADVTRVSGRRWERLTRELRWLASAGMGSVDAVYVELPTTSVMPHDLLLLAWARIRGRPVGIYFRDAYQRFRDLFPTRGARMRVADLLWSATTPLVKRLATVVFVPSAGLAEALGIRGAVLLPPGADPAMPFVGVGSAPLVGAIATLGPGGGADLLVEAVGLVRRRFPDVTLRIIGRGTLAPAPPPWVTVIPGRRDELPDLLGPALAVVIPLTINRYTDLAVPVRLMDLLALGKPIVATRSAETARLLDGHDAALLVDDTPEAIAVAIGRILSEGELAERLAAGARQLATSPGWRWDDRAAVVIGCLRPAIGDGPPS